MNPTRDMQATLVDLLDRAFDKGLILDADLIITLAGIPLLGVKLKAALAGMETMLRYGIWQDWDAAQRAIATAEQRRNEGALLAQGEDIILKAFASYWREQGSYHVWRPGQLYVTDRRVLLFRKEPAEILFQCSYREMVGVSASSGDSAGGETGCVHLRLVSGEVARLRARDAAIVEQTVKERMESLGQLTERSLPVAAISGVITERGCYKNTVVAGVKD